MGPMVVVVMQPVLRHVPDLLQGLKFVAVQHLGSIGLVEPFHVSVLRRLAGLNVVQSNALGRCPVRQGLGDELGPVVQTDKQRRPSHLYQFIKRPDHPRRRQAGVDLDAQAFAVEFVNHVECPELSP